MSERPSDFTRLDVGERRTDDTNPAEPVGQLSPVVAGLAAALRALVAACPSPEDLDLLADHCPNPGIAQRVRAQAVRLDDALQDAFDALESVGGG